MMKDKVAVVTGGTTPTYMIRDEQSGEYIYREEGTMDLNCKAILPHPLRLQRTQRQRPASLVLRDN